MKAGYYVEYYLELIPPRNTPRKFGQELFDCRALNLKENIQQNILNFGPFVIKVFIKTEVNFHICCNEISNTLTRVYKIR